MIIEQLQAKNEQGLFNLIKVFSDEFLLLPKSLDEIKASTDSFKVILEDDKVIACVMLDQFTDTLAEVRTLAVAKEHQGRGLGKLLVNDCELRAKSLGVKKVFALTYEDKFFHQMGYATVDKDSLPEKVLKTCIHCSQYSNCQEIAVIKNL